MKTNMSKGITTHIREVQQRREKRDRERVKKEKERVCVRNRQQKPSSIFSCMRQSISNRAGKTLFTKMSHCIWCYVPSSVRNVVPFVPRTNTVSNVMWGGNTHTLHTLTHENSFKSFGCVFHCHVWLSV